jgi:hypothetical protein
MVFSDSRYNEAGIGRYRAQLREVASLGLLSEMRKLTRSDFKETSPTCEWIAGHSGE